MCFIIDNYLLVIQIKNIDIDCPAKKQKWIVYDAKHSKGFLFMCTNYFISN